MIKSVYIFEARTENVFIGSCLLIYIRIYTITMFLNVPFLGASTAKHQTDFFYGLCRV